MALEWKPALKFEDIRYEKAEGIAKITINRPECRNAFRPLTVHEMRKALQDARDDSSIGVVILTGEGELAFCSGWYSCCDCRNHSHSVRDRCQLKSSPL